MNGNELKELFIPILGEKHFIKKLSDLSLFAHNTIGHYLRDKNRIIPAHVKYFEMLAREMAMKMLRMKKLVKWTCPKCQTTNFMHFTELAKLGI